MSCARGTDDEGDRRGVLVERAAALPGTECTEECALEGDGTRFMCGAVVVRRSAKSERGEVRGEGKDDDRNDSEEEMGSLAATGAGEGAGTAAAAPWWGLPRAVAAAGYRGDAAISAQSTLSS